MLQIPTIRLEFESRGIRIQIVLLKNKKVSKSNIHPLRCAQKYVSYKPASYNIIRNIRITYLLTLTIDGKRFADT